MPSVPSRRQFLETAALVPADQRASECVRLLEHLRSLYAMDVPAWQRALARGGEGTRRALERLRLLCRPLR